MQPKERTEGIKGSEAQLPRRLHIDKGGDKVMKVSVIWEHGEVTEMQSANALKIALEWLYSNTAILAVHCSTNKTLYLREV